MGQYITNVQSINIRKEVRKGALLIQWKEQQKMSWDLIPSGYNSIQTGLGVCAIEFITLWRKQAKGGAA